MLVRFLLAVCGCALALTLSAGAQAQRPEFSSFERETIEAALRSSGGELDPAPDGKLIEEIELVTVDVFDERDPVPDFVNVFHTKTLPYVIRRELLFRRGELYGSQRIDESARNLRALSPLSLVLIVPVRGSQPDRVRVLVITKDVWSLRLNSYFEIYNWEFVTLMLQPSEINLAGTHTHVSLLYTLDPGAYSFGAQLGDPRLAGSRVRTAVNGNVIFNRDTNEAEGSFGSLVYGQPLFSVDAKWAWGAYLAWRTDIERSYVGTELDRFDADATLQDDLIPLQWERDILFGEYQVTRSFGRRFKHDFSLGVEAQRRKFDPGDLSAFDPLAVAEFRREEVPVTDTRMSPFLQLRAHRAEFLRTLDLDALGLQEDYRIGHDATLRIYPASRELGSSRDLVGIFAALSYTVRLGDGLARAIAATTTELASDDQTDALFEGAARLITPRLGFGRIAYGTRVAHRYRNYLNQQFVLGGDNRLRGYEVNRFRGKDLIASNLELRSSSVEVLSTQLGGALFYDVGDAFDGFEQMRLKQGAGFGVRVLIPQLDRTVFRIDWGFPLDGRRIDPADILLNRWYATFGQAIPVPAVRRTGAADPRPSAARASAVTSTWAGETL